MKRIWFRKSFWQSLLSASVFGVFVYLALGSWEDHIKTTYLGNGIYREVFIDVLFKSALRTEGSVDEYGKWHGKIKFELENNMEFVRSEEVNMIHGKRHGESRISRPGRPDEIYCYNMGERIPCKKSAHIVTAEQSGYEILSYKYPWFVNQLNGFRYDNDYIKAFVDKLDSIIATYKFDATKFDDYYDDAVEELSKAKFDSILLLNRNLTISQGIDLLKNSELRMAVIDRYRSGEPSTFEKVKEKYSNYLVQLNNLKITNQDFKGFCQVFDSLMTSYGNLNVKDPFLLDSLDNRMYKAMDFINKSKKSASLNSLSMKSAFLINKYENIGSIYNMVNPLLRQILMNTGPKDVSDVIISLMNLEIQNADNIKNSVKIAYSIKNNIKTLPTVTTEITNLNSNTSIEVKGSVLEDGGAAITARGIVWGNFFNPDLGNQKINVGSGIGSFEALIKGYIKGQTYYARAFATNSVGTVYGNCVSFIAVNTVVEDNLTMSIENLPNFSNARAAHQQIVIGSNKFIIIGGHVNGFSLSKNAEFYDANTKKWQTALTQSNHDMGFAAKLNNGKYLIGGGCSSSSGVGQLAATEIFDPSDNSFTTSANMKVARTNASAGTLKDGRVLVVGNWYASAANAEVYNPATNTFTLTGGCLVARSFPTIIPTDDGGAIVCGGLGNYGGAPSKHVFEKYNPVTNTFSELLTTLFNGETSWDITCYVPTMTHQYLMPNGKYAVLVYNTAGTLARLISIDPATSKIEEIITQKPIPLVDETDATKKFGCARTLMIDQNRDLLHIIQQGGTNSNIVLRIVTINLKTGSVNTSQKDGFDYSVASSNLSMLPDGRILFTGGNKFDNFTLSNKAFIVTLGNGNLTSIAGLKKENNNMFTIYPNPAKTTINIQLKALVNEKSKIEIFDFSGRLVHVSKIENTYSNSNPHAIDISKFSNGIYNCRVSNDEYFSNLKFVISK